MGGKFVKEEYNYGINKINSWYEKKNKTLTIVSPPYNEEIIFGDIILKVLKNNGRVLYIWNGNKSNKIILENIKKHEGNISTNFIKSGDCTEKLVFTNSKYTEKITGNFDLVIYDDITEFSDTTKQEIAIKHIWLGHIGKKIILYTIEKSINIGENFELTYLHKNNPFVEPRIVPTKIDLEKDLPYTVYDYLKWFMDNKENTVIIVPDEQKVQFVYDYYSNKVKVSDCRIHAVKKREYNNLLFNNELKVKDKATIIITDSIDLSVIKNNYVNIIVLFSDDRKYNYKGLLYLCGKIGKNNKAIPEVLLVFNNETDDINQVKILARGFNKKVWDRNYSDYLK